MRRLAPLVVPLLLLTAGCVAKGDDPFAYAKKPLYSSTFHLDRVGPDGDGQMFRVQDGSIAAIHAFVWVNATAGDVEVTLTDPAGRVMLVTSEDTDRVYRLELGEWRIRVTASEDAAGQVGVHVVRA